MLAIVGAIFAANQVYFAASIAAYEDNYYGEQVSRVSSFYGAMLCIRGTRHGPVSVCVSVSVCLSQVGVLLKRLNESGWFLACELPSTRPTLC